VLLSDGSEVQIQYLELGQILYGGSIVEAIIECPVAKAPLYEIYGVKVSGGHKIWSKDLLEFIQVSEHPDAKISDIEISTLWTLITSNREIPVKGLIEGKPHIRFADWEEMPPTLKSAIDWNRIANMMLNGELPDKDPSEIFEGPCIEDSVIIYKYQGGMIPIADVRIGDWIYDIYGWTKVIGKCTRIVNSGIGYHGQRISNGNWVLDYDTWKRPRGVSKLGKWQGYQLITESGSFMININLQQLIVRDFTEVGCENLIESYRQEDAVR
jgi:hypothetical protein